MSLEKIRREFDDALEGLKNIHSREDLKAQQEKVEEAKAKLWNASAEFRRDFEARASVMRAKAAQMRLKHGIQTRDFTSPTFHRGYGDFAPSMVPDEEEMLACPECYTTNVNWLRVNRKKARKLNLRKGVREIAWCLKCRKKMVPMLMGEIRRKRREKLEEKIK